MDSGIRRCIQLGAALVALSAPLLAQLRMGPATPEPATFWLIGAGAGAILLLRKLRAKK
jgi:hypothetical protein